MRKEDIERLKELDAKATPGPWHIDDIRLGDPTLFRVTDNGSFQLGTIHEQVDVELIAEMRNALPQLLAANAALRERLTIESRERKAWRACRKGGYIRWTTVPKPHHMALSQELTRAWNATDALEAKATDACGAMGSGTT